MPETSKTIRRRPLAGVLAWMVSGSLLMLAVASILLVALHGRELMARAEQQTLEREVEMLHLSLQSWLQDRHESLRENVRLLSLQSDGDGRQSLLSLLNSLQLLGESYPLYLVSHKDGLLGNREDAPPWWHAEVKKSVNAPSVVRQEDQAYWQISTVLLNNPDLFLTARIPISEFQSRLHLEQRLEGIYLRLERDGEVLATVGRPVHDSLVFEQDWGEEGVRVHYEMDTSALMEEREHIIWEIALLSLLVIGLAGVASYQMGMKWLVRPVRRLQQAAASLADSERSDMDLLVASSRIRELHLLARDFRKMAADVQKREEALSRRNTMLLELTERLQSNQAQLIRSERMASIGTLAAGVAHEINNPLGFMKSNLSTLDQYVCTLMVLVQFCHQQHQHPAFVEQLSLKLQQAESEDDLVYMLEDLKPLLDESREGVDRIQVIVQGLKTFADAGPGDTELVDVNKVIESTCAVMRSDVGVRCPIEIDTGEVPAVRGGEAQLNQVMLNLIRNAGQASEEGAEIRVRSWLEAGEVYVAVTDQGEGIEEQALSKIFTPFYTTRPIGTGAGLGLSISHNIVEQYHGRITVTSEVGRGTTFTVILPAVMNATSDHRETETVVG